MAGLTKKEAAKMLGVTLRQVTRYLTDGKLSVDHMEKGKVMINIAEIYSLRAELRKRKRG